MNDVHTLLGRFTPRGPRRLEPAGDHALRRPQSAIADATAAPCGRAPPALPPRWSEAQPRERAGRNNELKAEGHVRR
jgi:hypothetical protein